MSEERTRGHQLLREWMSLKGKTFSEIAGRVYATKPTAYGWGKGAVPDDEYRIRLELLTERAVPADAWMHPPEAGHD